MSKIIGIDLGTTSIIVAVGNQGVVLNESSVVAVDTRKNKVLAVGDAENCKNADYHAPNLANIQLARMIASGEIA